MSIENPDIRNLREANLDKLKSPYYRAGSLDGFIYTDVQRRNWGYEVSLHGDSTSTDVAAVWHQLTNAEGSLSPDGKRWSIYNIDVLLEFFSGPLTPLLILRKEEISRFIQFVESLKKMQSGKFEPKEFERLKYYLEYYQELKTRNTIPQDIDYLNPAYITGLFELSPKGTIRFEKPAKFNSSGRLIVQMATPQLSFANYMEKKYSGGSFVIKPNASFLWKVTGRKAESFIQDVLLPNSVWGEKVLLRKVIANTVEEQ